MKTTYKLYLPSLVAGVLLMSVLACAQTSTTASPEPPTSPPEPLTSTPEPTPFTGQDVTTTDGGYRITLPEGWTTQQDDTHLIAANRPLEDLQGSGAMPDDTLVFGLNTLPPEGDAAQVTPDTLGEFAGAYMADEMAQIQVTAGPDPVTVAGASAVHMDITLPDVPTAAGGIGQGEVIVGIHPGGRGVFVVVAYSPDHQWQDYQPLVETLLSHLTFLPSG